MNVYEAIKTKRAIRKFEDTPIPQDQINKILNAGRRAQSAKNSQPWHFISITNKGTLKKLSKMGLFAGHLADAALAIAIITPPPEKRFSIMFDAGQSASYMQLIAWELGIGSCLATIYNPDKARPLLEFPQSKEIRIAISFGYPASKYLKPRKPKNKGRRKIDDVVHVEKWTGK
ncbi:MAG: nitroreductase family protein [Chloroflexota bacterium]